MGKGPQNAGDPSALDPPVVAMEELDNDRLDAVNEYDKFARKLSEECNIPQEKHGDLCEALMGAYDAYDDIQHANDRKARIRSSVKNVRDFQRKMEGACKAWGMLDDLTRTMITRAVEAKHEDAFFERTTTRLGPSFLRRLTLDRLGADIVEAAEQCMAHTAAPRGRPADDALKAFVAVLREFWVGELGKAFYDNFQEDLGSGEYEPVNDASRFVVEAIEALIGDVNVGTCRHMMRAVNKAT